MKNDTLIFFVSDLHGDIRRYRMLMDMMVQRKPGCVMLGGDFLPHAMMKKYTGKGVVTDFIHDFIEEEFSTLKNKMGNDYPEIFMIAGNDDPRAEEINMIELEGKGLWTCLNSRSAQFSGFTVTGYPFVPPTPFTMKDWEKYDVSRYVDPGCTHPDEGMRTYPVSPDSIEWGTIAADLDELSAGIDMNKAIFLFHSPPYKSSLDRAALDGMSFDHVPLDVHVGSIAIARFIEKMQPRVTLHGHVHESSRITGVWKEMTGNTVAMNAAVEKDHFCLISFDINNPENASREIFSLC